VTAVHVLVMAKAPVVGRVKTRLCPPLTLSQAAELAEAALADTLEAVAGSGAARKLLALDGPPGPWLPTGFEVFPQQGAGFAERLAAAWSHANGPGLQIGMDTPQVTASLLDHALERLVAPGTTAVLGPAVDGGWWSIGLRKPDAAVFLDIPMSTPSTGLAQERRLRALGHQLVLLPELRDVDHVEDAGAVADLVPHSRFASAFRRTLETVP
jgi:glycosyltransferase A (GT-A) superfamily protein (DUF2064 family)